MVDLPNVAIIRYVACSLGNHQTDKSITIPAEMITDFEITYPTNISSVYGSVTFDGMFDFGSTEEPEVVDEDEEEDEE